MSVVGSDAFEDAPLLTFGEYGGNTASAGLTSDAVDVDWGTTRTAWWKVVVPADYDPAAGPIRVLMEATTTYPAPTGRPPEVFVWTGTDAATRVAVDWGVSVDLSDISPGTTLNVEAVQWEQPGVDAAEYDSWTYRVVAGAVTYSYTGWIQGPNVTSDFAEEGSEHGDVRAASKTETPVVTGPAYDGAINNGLNWLAANQTYSIQPGSIAHTQDYQSSLEMRAHTFPDDRETAFAYSGGYNDMGLYVAADTGLLDVSASYQSTLTPPDDGQTYVASELAESGTAAFTVVSASYRLHLQSPGPVGGAPLVVETYVRPGPHDSTLGGSTRVDKHAYNGAELRTLEFTTSDLAGGNGVHIFPLISFGESLPWTGTTPTLQPADNSIMSRAANAVFLQDANPANPGVPRPVEVAITVQPPRHRFKIEHFLATTARRAHLRQYPRSPLRHWPPERSVQRSNRRAGGYK